MILTFCFISDKLTPLVLSSQPKLLSVNVSNNIIQDIHYKDGVPPRPGGAGEAVEDSVGYLRQLPLTPTGLAPLPGVTEGHAFGAPDPSKGPYIPYIE